MTWKFRILYVSCLMLLAFQTSFADPQEKLFKTPEDAAEALSLAVQTQDRAALKELFGSDLSKIDGMNSDELTATVMKLMALFQEGWSLSTAQTHDKIIRLGHEGWGFPVPIVRGDAGWHFDTAEGNEEILNRRVGRNELLAIETCRLMIQAQKKYRDEDLNKNGTADYASKFLSEEGKRDGLYWSKSGDDVSPLEQMFENPNAFSNAITSKQSWFGYNFHLEPNKDKFTIFARPAAYQTTGVMTFICNEQGQVYEKDLGKDADSSPVVLDKESWYLVDEQI